MKENFRKYLVEFIGAFFLIFTIGAVTRLGVPGVIPPLAIGFILMVMVYAGGFISGGHYNPAVSLAAVVRGSLPAYQWVPYAVSQILGGITAAFVVNYLAGDAPEATAMMFSIPAIIIGEFIFTFALCYVVLLTATAREVEGNSYYGLAIGSTVMVGAFAVGGICLAAFNPAVALSCIVMHTICCLKLAIITSVVNLVAAVAAGVTYKAVNGN